MIQLRDITVILLAAGLSRRFGPANKLAQQFRGKPLLSHISETLSALPFRRWLVILSAGDHRLTAEIAGFERIENAQPERGMGHSLALGAQGVSADHPGAVLFCLGDMPFVTSAHIKAMAQRFDVATADIVASSDGGTAGPPSLFGSHHLPELSRLDGDHGAKALLGNAVLIQATSNELVDLDQPQDFELRCVRS